ncbi:MAG: SDR family oxidoreductase [Deltaproteobacteria bacterium]|nr:SDR family oxidoreductase [Deltaproteobacteria bacterium]
MTRPLKGGPDVVDVRTMLRTLQALADDPRAVKDLDPRQRLALVEAARTISGRPPRPKRARPLPLPPELEQTLTATTTTTTQPCYVCGIATSAVIDALCPACRASEQLAARALERATLDQALGGRVVVVTGARVNIGFASALAALRLGAVVVGTTRFVDDARARFAACADAEVWRDRLRLFALDLRDLPGVEQLALRLGETVEGVDAVVHNAAQTLPMSSAERAALSSALLMPPGSEALVRALSPSSSLAVGHGPYGVAPDESWRAKLKDVSTRELLEVLLINAAAPFVLTRALLPLLRRCPRRPRVVVNVTSSEGRFSFSRHEEADDDGAFEPLDSDGRGERRGKSARHPHLNMAKAALNMMTRTSASELSKDHIVLVGVDPGWVSGPLPGGGFKNGRFPLDADEAARRVLHPVLLTARGTPPQRGVLYKNYRPAPW